MHYGLPAIAITNTFTDQNTPSNGTRTRALITSFEPIISTLARLSGLHPSATRTLSVSLAHTVPLADCVPACVINLDNLQTTSPQSAATALNFRLCSTPWRQHTSAVTAKTAIQFAE